LLDLPGGRGLTVAQAHDHVADPDRLAWPQGQVALEAVALVEQADHGDPLGHRSRSRREALHGLRDVHRLVLDRRRILAVVVDSPLRRAGGERERRRKAEDRGESAHRDQSGVQA
jgi:hypothetical protein